MQAGPCKSVPRFDIRPGFSLALFDRSSLQQSSSQPENPGKLNVVLWWPVTFWKVHHHWNLGISSSLRSLACMNLSASLFGQSLGKDVAKRQVKSLLYFCKRASKPKKKMSEVSVGLTCPPVQWVRELDEAWCGLDRYPLWILAAWNFLCRQSHLVGLEAHRFLG